MTDDTKTAADTPATDETLTGAAETTFGAFDKLTHGELSEGLQGLITEAEAGLASGDVMVQKWARATGTLATALLRLHQNDAPAGGAPTDPKAGIERL